MESKLTLYNTLDRRKELFEPINPPHVGLYVCGPTVYGNSIQMNLFPMSRLRLLTIKPYPMEKYPI